jgi:type IV pilus assembly protein PilW
VNRVNVKGFTLIELMISMVLGLVIVGGVISVVLANRRTYNTNEGLSQVQESARTAFELLARDIRQAAGNGCDNTAGTSNVLNASTDWWRDWYGMQGFDETETDTAVADGPGTELRVPGTDSIHTQGLDGAALPIDTHTPASGRLQINATTTPFAANDIMVVCDFDHSAIFQASGYEASPPVVLHEAFAGAPGNCQQGLGFPADCSDTVGIPYPYPRNAQIGRMAAVAWFVGENGRTGESGRSLYRIRLGAGGALVTEEVVAGITDMQLTYGVNGSDDIEDATAIADWAEVSSVFVRITADSADTNVTTDNTVNNGRIQKTFTYLITLRNRVP